MTISSEVRKTEPFIGNDATTALPFAFKVFTADEVLVVRANSAGVETTLVLNTDYTVSLNPDQNANPGGTVTLTSPLATGFTVVVSSDIDNLQPTDLTNQGGFYPQVVTNALDRLTILVQQVAEGLSRAVKTKITDSRTGDELLADIFEAEENAAASAAAAEESANRVDLGALDQAVADAEAAELGAQTAQGQSEAARDESVAAAEQTAAATAFRSIPAAYSWAGIYPTICQAPGKAQFSENVSKYARRVYSSFIGAGTIYVDPVNGLDTNSGSASSPVKTISKAVRDLGPSLVLCLPGVYKPFEFRTTDAQGNKLKIVRAVGPCTIEEDADDPNAATWTADGTYPNTYWMPLTPANKDILAVLDTSRLDEEGQPIPLAKYGSILDANNSGLGWFHDTAADRLYIRYIGNANLNTVKSRFKLVTGDAASRILVLGTKLLMEGDWQLSGVFFTVLQNAGVRPYLFGEFEPSKYRPTVRHTISHALDSLGADTYIQNAWFHRAKGDNFHYFDSGGVKVRGVEIDCKATYAGDIATELAAPNTSNGSSMHNTGDVLRINGEYRRNYGPDVVDTGTGESWNVGTESGPCATSANAYGFYTTGPIMRLDTCSAFGQDQADIAATTGGQILKYATSFRTSSTAGSPVGTIVDYVPS